MNHIASWMDRSAGLDRVSVENLLGPPLRDDRSYVDQYSSVMDAFKTQDVVPQGPNALYGVDCGEPDMGDGDDDDDVEDIPRHDFNGYDNGSSSMMMTMSTMGRAGYSNNDGNYYPFCPTIPRKLDPLPHFLRYNSKNMMYFHHYLNHTARLLVPHDCSANPFRSILPQSKQSPFSSTLH
jgi:hypothetical protein